MTAKDVLPFVAALALGLGAPATAPAASYIGSLHEHSAYSDGYPGTRPATVFANGARHGLDFMGISDHSDTFGVPLSVSGDCAANPLQDGCLAADTANPADSLRKWDATGEQAAAATTRSFTGIRGFEWTSDRFGHINVFFSSNWTGAKQDGGYAAMPTFYSWLERPAALGGGDDGLATFNHPGDKKLSTSDPGFNWDDFAYVPQADARMVGIEVYNSASDFGAPGAHGGPAEGWYAHALDKGWHLGAVGAEDLGHDRGDDWGGPGQAKTVILAADRSAPALKAAMAARRFYAVSGPGVRLRYTVDGAPMGSRITRRPGRPLRFDAQVTDAGGKDLRDATLELVTNGGRKVARGAHGRLAQHLRARDGWYFVRALRRGKPIAYSSPVWVER